MTRTRQRKCRCCGQLYEPDPRNRYHQRYCRQPACRQASKTASQQRWRASPKGKDYFRGLANRQRVKAWRQAHPGYWRKRGQKSRVLQDRGLSQAIVLPADTFTSPRALQDHCLSQPLVPPGDKVILTRALQDIIYTQGLVLTGLISQLTDSALQENIALTTRRLVLLGQQIQGSSSWRPADGRDQEASLMPGVTAASAAAVQLDRPSPGP